MEHIQFTLMGLFEWIFGILVALVVFFLYSTFKQNADEKKDMMDRINKLSDILMKLQTEHNIAMRKNFPHGNGGDS